MGFMDRFKKVRAKADDLAEEHGDKIKDGIDKAARAAEKRAGPKHADKIRKGAQKAKGAVDDAAKPDQAETPAEPGDPAVSGGNGTAGNRGA
ncbi:MAG TPA: antitoxin [Thermoleophilaceae bacterium]|nr:antitoxin [Thermoleophilaceae bacterium]